MTLIDYGAGVTRGTHISFLLSGKSETGKTNVYTVFDETGKIALGAIRWFGRWRKYAFFPSEGMVFENTCLAELSEFCARESKAHRSSVQARNLQNPRT